MSDKMNEIIDLCESDEDISDSKQLLTSTWVSQKPSRSQAKTEEEPFDSTWQPFYLNSLRSDAISAPARMNNSSQCLAVEDIICTEQEDISNVVILTFEIDPLWLLTRVPSLTHLPLIVLHGGSTKIEGIDLDNVTMSPVDMGNERYGTHHNKIIFVFYKRGLRVAITTANFTEVDWTLKLQGTYVQDFPRKSSASSSEFECGLLAHCDRIVPMGRKAQEQWTTTLEQLRLYDFSSAEVVLISSVPGRHQGPGRYKWGQWKLREELRQAAVTVDEDSAYDDKNNITDRTILMQFSSIGSLKNNESFIDELAASMSTSSQILTDECPKKKQKFDPKEVKKSLNERNEGKGGQGRTEVELVWPTVDCVRGSVQGWAAGFSLPSDEKVIYGDDFMSSFPFSCRLASLIGIIMFL